MVQWRVAPAPSPFIRQGLRSQDRRSMGWIPGRACQPPNGSRYAGSFCGSLKFVMVPLLVAASAVSPCSGLCSGHDKVRRGVTWSAFTGYTRDRAAICILCRVFCTFWLDQLSLLFLLGVSLYVYMELYVYGVLVCGRGFVL